MLDSVRSVLASAAGAANKRLELLGADVRAERSRIAASAALALAALFFAGLGVVFLAFTVMVAAWDHFRLGAAALLSLSFLAAAGYAAFRLQGFARSQPRVFEASLAQLERDREQLARPAPRVRLVEGALQAGQWIGAALVLVSVVRRALGRK